MVYKWDVRWMRIAREVSSWSKDPSRKVGAVAVRNNRIVAQGYNGFPRKFPDVDEWYQDRETKYKYIVHAELNLILNAVYHGITLKDSTVYLYGLPPCVECAKALAQAGVNRLVIFHGDLPARWADSLNTASEVLAMTQVEVVTLAVDLDDLDAQ